MYLAVRVFDYVYIYIYMYLTIRVCHYAFICLYTCLTMLVFEDRRYSALHVLDDGFDHMRIDSYALLIVHVT